VDLRAHKGRKAPLVRKVPPVSVAKPARLARKGRLVLRVHRAKPAHRGRQGLPANAVKLDRKALQVRSVQPDHPAPKAIRAQHLRSRVVTGTDGAHCSDDEVSGVAVVRERRD